MYLLGKLSDARTAEAALKTCEEIDKLESDADRVMRSAMSKLFREEPDVREVIKLKAIYELLETITDKCEDVANVDRGHRPRELLRPRMEVTQAALWVVILLVVAGAACSTS